MNSNLKSLLDKVSSSEGNVQTHTTVFDGVAYTIDSKDELFYGYIKLVDFESENKNSTLCLAENVKNETLVPISVNLILEYETTDDDEQWEPYCDLFLYTVSHVCQKVIKNTFKISSSEETTSDSNDEDDSQFRELMICVLESDCWHDFKEDKKFLKVEIKFQFPYAKISLEKLNTLLIPKIIKELSIKNVLKTLDQTPLGTWENIIVKNSKKNPILLFGSSQNLERPKLKLTRIWPYISEDDLLEDCDNLAVDLDDEVQLSSVFALENHSIFGIQGAKKKRFQGFSILQLLPLFLSLGYYPKTLIPVLKEQARKIVGNSIISEIKDSNGRSISKTPDGELCKILIEFVSSKRFLEQHFWEDIGRALYNSYRGEKSRDGEIPTGLKIWIKYTKKAIEKEKINETCFLYKQNVNDLCMERYYSFRGNEKITVRSLAWYAKSDNFKDYSSWHAKWCLETVIDATHLLDRDVGHAIYRLYWLNFVFSTKARTWFEFKDNRWHEVPLQYRILYFTSNDFVERTELIHREIMMDYSGQTKDKKEQLDKINMGLLNLKKKLKTNNARKNYVELAKEFFANDYFTEYLDENPELLGMENGILEIKKDRVVFRESKPEDYVRMNTQVYYIRELNRKHNLVIECWDWMCKIFTDEELRNHFMKFAASCLKGKNMDKIFPIFTGSGDNSKSMVVKLFECVFGPYCIKFDISNFTARNNNPNAATPQTARAKFARMVFIDEPADEVPMNKELIKRMTGGDSFFGRALHDNGGEIKVNFKMVLTCNNPPIILNPDKAIKNRVKLFPFLSVFENNPPEDLKDQFIQRRFKKNCSFEDRIPCLAGAFLWLLVNEFYPMYCREGITKEPPIVTQVTDNYWKTKDIYYQFISEEVEICKNDLEACVTVGELYKVFMEWFKSICPGTKTPDRSCFTNSIEVHCGNAKGNSWVGLKIKKKKEDSMFETFVKRSPKKFILVEEVKESKEEVQYDPLKEVKEQKKVQNTDFLLGANSGSDFVLNLS